LQSHFQQNPWCSLASKIHIKPCRLQQVDAAQLLRLFCGNFPTRKLSNVKEFFRICAAIVQALTVSVDGIATGPICEAITWLHMTLIVLQQQ
jgi:hypothetical protein